MLTDVCFVCADGTFFITGRRFVAFHVRNREISRGGLRVVQPPSMEAHGAAAAGAYDEAYALAYAQQLKNKVRSPLLLSLSLSLCLCQSALLAPA